VVTTARHLQSSCRWGSCLGKIAEVVSCCLPHGFYFRVSFSWIVGCSSIINTSMQGSYQRQPCCHRAVMVVQERCCAFELQPSRERPADDVITAFLATDMLPPCRQGDPGTLQCVGCLTRRLRGNIPHVESTNLF